MCNNTVVSKIVSAALLLFAVVFCQSSYADSDTSLVEITPAALHFDRPGTKTVRIINRSSRPIAARDIFFFGNQFTMVPTLRTISTDVLKKCQKVGPNQSCKFNVTAATNGSATSNVDDADTTFTVVYHFTDAKKKLYTLDFESRVDYNKDIKFTYRNLMFHNEDFIDYARDTIAGIFSGEEKVVDKLKDSEKALKLEMTNSNPDRAISITNISLPPKEHRGGAAVRIGKYNSCSNLAPGATCSVNIIVDDKSKDAALPISILYDIGNRKGVLTTAAVVIKRDKSETKLLEAALSGGVTGGAIYVSNNSLGNTINHYIASPSDNDAKSIATDLGIKSPIDGVLYSMALPYTAGLDNRWNRIAFMGTMSYGISALGFEAADDASTRGIKFLKTFAPTFLGSWFGSLVEDHFPGSYYPYDYVPEDMGWFGAAWHRWFVRSMPFGFGVSATLRESTKAMMASDPWGNVLTKTARSAAQDIVASTAMTGMAKAMYGRGSNLPMVKTGKKSVTKK